MANVMLLGENASDSGVSSVKIFENEQFGKVRSIVINGEPWFSGKDVASILGYSNTNDAIISHVDEEDKQIIQLSDIQDPRETLPSHLRGSKAVIINESGLYSLIFGSTLESAKSFKHWVTSEILPSIRKTGFYSTKNEPSFEDKLKAATWAAEFLNLNDVSKLAMAKCILDPLGLPTPDYVPSKGVIKSATDLLKANNVQMSAIAFNKIALNKGVLIEKERKSSHGFKKFKNIADGWLEFGENQVNPNNPKETQPLWYEKKFPELLRRLDIL